MPAATSIAIAGLATAAAGTGVSAYSSNKQAQASKKAEEVRERMMRVEAEAARTKAHRNAQRERALANASATAQGAYAGSGAEGGFSQIMSNAGNRVGDVNVNEYLGGQMFRANAQYSQYGAIKEIGGGMMRLGTSVFGSSQALGNMLQGPQALDPSWSYTIKPPSHWGG